MRKRAQTMSRSRSQRSGVGSRRARVLRVSFPKRQISNRGKSSRAGAGKGSQRTKAGLRGRSAKLTTNHDEIRAWVEARGGHPATVTRSTKGGNPAGILRIDFPGFSGAGTLKKVSWDEWFKVFDERRLGFLHQDRTASGKQSRFNKLVCRT